MIVFTPAQLKTMVDDSATITETLLIKKYVIDNQPFYKFCDFSALIVFINLHILMLTLPKTQ